MGAEVTLHQEYEQEPPPVDPLPRHPQGTRHVKHPELRSDNISEIASHSAPALTRRPWWRGEPGASSGRGARRGPGGRTSLTAWEVSLTRMRRAEINISFEGGAVKKQQSFESYLDSDGNKKQQDIEFSDSYPGWRSALWSPEQSHPVSFLCLYINNLGTFNKNHNFV